MQYQATSAGSGYRGRFAPSPTGPLHAGSMLAAFASWLRARSLGGQWRLRVEDIDPPREQPGAAEGQLRTLAAFGLHHDGPVLHQRDRDAAYGAALRRLLDRGDAFHCHCSRSDLAATGGIHRRCVARRRRPDPAVRLRVADGTGIAFDDAIQGPQMQRVDLDAGDFVLRRSDGLWAYQLAVVVDDAAQGITEVVRGADLLASTPRQIVLQRALGLPTPHYAHLPLICAADGSKLSKSTAALPVDAARPLPLLAAVWGMLGQPSLAATSHADFLAGAVVAFDMARIPATLALDCAASHNALSSATT